MPITEGQAHAPRAWAARVHGAPIDDHTPARTAAALALGLAAIGLYHRLTKDRVLEHPTRRRTLELLDETPGMTTRELADALGVSFRTALHHADMLATFDLVVCEERHGPTRWCLPRDAGGLAPPISEPERTLVDLVDRAEGLHLSEIARRLDAAKATVKHRLDRLIEQGWVTDERVGPLRRFSATPEGLERLGRD